MSTKIDLASGHGKSPARKVMLALVVLGIIWFGALCLHAALQARNGYYTCGFYEPASMAFLEHLTQITSRVTLFPLTLECTYSNASYTVGTGPVVVQKDLGTAWWIGVPASFLAAIIVGGANRNRAPKTVTTNKK